MTPAVAGQGTASVAAQPVPVRRALRSYRGHNNHNVNHKGRNPINLDGSTPTSGEDSVLALELLPLADQVDIGVDRVRLHFELDCDRTDGPAMDAYRHRKGANVTVIVDGAELVVHITIRTQGGMLGGVRMWASVEFNPSHVAQAQTGSPEALCPLNQVRSVCANVLALVADIAPALPDSVCLAGLHLTRDFAVADPSGWVTAVVGTRPAWSREQALYVSSTGAAETVVSGSKSRRVVVYAKSPNTLRWESQVTTSRALARLGLDGVADLNSTALASATASLWRHSRLASARRRPRLVDLVAEAKDNASDVREFYGWLAARAEGVRLDRGLSSQRARAFKTRADALGIEVSGRSVAVITPGWRLDIVAGTEVAVAGDR